MKQVDTQQVFIEVEPNVVLIFGKEGCSWCKRATDECFKFNQVYEYYDIHKDLTDEAFLHLFGVAAPYARSVPIVIINGVWIGGFTELKQWLHNGRLGPSG